MTNEDFEELDFVQPHKIFGELISVDVLDKIKAEINNINLNEVATKYEDRFYGFQQEVIKIIDKYKADKKPTCGDCKEWGTVNCTETYREPTESDDACDSFKTESEG